MWLLGPAGFPEGSGEKKKKKQFIHSVIQSECCSQKYCSPRALLLPVTAECCCWCCCSPPSRGRICPRRAEYLKEGASEARRVEVGYSRADGRGIHAPVAV